MQSKIGFSAGYETSSCWSRSIRCPTGTSSYIIANAGNKLATSKRLVRREGVHLKVAVQVTSVYVHNGSHRHHQSTTEAQSTGLRVYCSCRGVCLSNTLQRHLSHHHVQFRGRWVNMYDLTSEEKGIVLSASTWCQYLESMSERKKFDIDQLQQEQ